MGKNKVDRDAICQALGCNAYGRLRYIASLLDGNEPDRNVQIRNELRDLLSFFASDDPSVPGRTQELLRTVDTFAARQYNGTAPEFENTRSVFVLGYIVGGAMHTDNVLTREACFKALGMRYGWDGERIAIEIMAG